MARLTGLIFSDLGLASSFMSVEWVKIALERSLGFFPFPATLNVRPSAAEDAETWRRVQAESAGMPLVPPGGGFCGARLYPIEVFCEAGGSNRIGGAVLVPEVKGYPSDKIEIVAPVRLKDHFGVRDGDPLTLEFVN
jgi:CTP-dependent riboflavin kinase